MQVLSGLEEIWHDIIIYVENYGKYDTNGWSYVKHRTVIIRLWCKFLRNY